MINWVIEIMELYGYIGVFIMMALENIFPPIPSEVILLFGGFMTTYTNVTVLGVMITATTGSVIGAVILYGVGTIFSISRLEAAIDKWGSVFKLTKEDLQKANHWFEQYGYKAVLFCRMIPLARSLISIPAGMSKMTFWIFLLFTMIGTVIWNIVLVLAGVFLGASWQEILRFLEVYSVIVYLLVGIGLVVLTSVLIKRKKV